MVVPPKEICFRRVWRNNRYKTARSGKTAKYPLLKGKSEVAKSQD